MVSDSSILILLDQPFMCICTKIFNKFFLVNMKDISGQNRKLFAIC